MRDQWICRKAINFKQVEALTNIVWLSIDWLVKIYELILLNISF